MAVRTKSQIATDIADKFADNTAGDISAQDLREVTTDLNDTLDTKTGAPAAAAEGTAGVVEGASSAEAGAASGTVFRAWTNNLLRTFLNAALPTVSAGDATTGTSTARRAWTAARVRAAANAAIQALVPAVFRQGNTDLIPTSKMGSGTRDGSTALLGDGTFGAITPSMGGPLNAVALVKVGDTLNLSTSATTGPAFSDLSDVFWLSFRYTRSPNTLIRFNTLIRKADIEGVVAGSAYRLQLQGGGGAFITLYDNGSGILIIGALDTGYTAGVCDVFKVTGAEDGITLTAGDARYLQLSGGTLTGLVTLSGAPTSDLHAATKKYVDDNAGGGSAYDDTALHEAIDALDVPELIGTYSDADADDLATGYGGYPSTDGTFTDADFAISGTYAGGIVGRIYVRIPKHKSRYGVRINDADDNYPNRDPASLEHLVKISDSDRPADADDTVDYFHVGYGNDDGAITLLGDNTGPWTLQLADVTRREVVNIASWQDGTRTPVVSPSTKNLHSIRAGQLIPVVFPAMNKPRNLHFAIPGHLEVTAIYIAGSSALADFTETTRSRSKFYDSARIQSVDEVSCLIQIEES